MPIHDWTCVDAGIFHAFHHDWITEVARALNRGLLPPDHYALPEQHAAGFGPDVLTLQEETTEDDSADFASPDPMGGNVLLAPPKLRPVAQTDLNFYRRKQKHVAVRHVSGDRIVAIVEIVSPGNKAARNPLRAFVAKAAELVDQQIHLLIVDLFPCGRRDPNGLHGEIWEEISGQDYTAPADKPLALVAYESGTVVRAFVVPTAVGETLSAMPLFLEPDKSVEVPLEATYTAAFSDTPKRWRRVLEPTRD